MRVQERECEEVRGRYIHIARGRVTRIECEQVTDAAAAAKVVKVTCLGDKRDFQIINSY